MHIDAPSRFAEDRRNIRFDDVGPKGQERSRAVVDNEHCLLVEEAINQRVVAGTHDYAVLVDEVELIHRKCLVLGE